MRSRVLWRRSATALGVSTATALGFLTTVVATRELGVNDYARLAAVLAATAFLQVLFGLTIEEALVKYGFRYTESQRWGRLRRLFEVALGFKLLGGVLALVALLWWWRPFLLGDAYGPAFREHAASAARLILGAAGATLVSTIVFCALWLVLLSRVRGDRVRTEALAT